jgi:hypothetical protein
MNRTNKVLVPADVTHDSYVRPSTLSAADPIPSILKGIYAVRY